MCHGYFNVWHISNLMPQFNVNGDVVKVEMTEIVQFFMYLSATINLLLIKINTSDILSSNITQSAMGALLQFLAQLVRCNNI